MKARLANAEAVRRAVNAGQFCDCGHYHCARMEPDQTVIWPSGAVLTTDDVFKGPRQLYEELARIPADHAPPTVHPMDRYPRDNGGPALDWENRSCMSDMWRLPNEIDYKIWEAENDHA